MRVPVCLFAILLIIGCGSGDNENKGEDKKTSDLSVVPDDKKDKKDTAQAKKETPPLPPPAFDEKDPHRSYHWLKPIAIGMYRVKDSGNAVALEREETNLKTAVKSVEGKTISWRWRITHVAIEQGTPGVGLKTLNLPYGEDTVIQAMGGHLKTIPADLSPAFLFGISGSGRDTVPVTGDAAWVEGLKRGDEVLITGTITKAHFHRHGLGEVFTTAVVLQVKGTATRASQR